jgi:cardiolipin synthase
MPSNWKSEEIFFDGDTFFERLLSDIDQAKSYITIEMYIFNDDILGKKIVAHLIAAHQRGVKVQVIVDGIGSFNFSRKLQGILYKKGITVKMYNPLPFYHPYFGNLSFTKRIQVMASRIWRMNRRDHRKIITIDQTIMFTGSFNITAESTRYHIDRPWKVMGVRVSGDDV